MTNLSCIFEQTTGDHFRPACHVRWDIVPIHEMSVGDRGDWQNGGKRRNQHKSAPILRRFRLVALEIPYDSILWPL